jgi:F-type H+-transporting ATPase subunit b
MFVTEAQAQTAEPTVGTTPITAEPVTHGEHTEVPAGEHHSGVFPPMDSTYFPSQLLWLAITFGLFYWVLQKAILPRIGGIIENRRDRIALDLDAAQKMKSDADGALAAYQQELTAARERSHSIAAAARDTAKVDAEAERVRVEATLDEKLAVAQARIDEIKRSALADVGAIAEDATAAILDAVAGLDVPRDEVAGAVRAVRS